MSFDRTARVSSQVQQIVARVLAFEVKDPRVAGITVTDVEISPDLREAKIFVAAPVQKDERRDMMVGLERARGFIRRQLGRELRARVTPNLNFRWDESIAYGARIEAKLRELGLGGTTAPELPSQAEESDGTTSEE